MDAKSARKPPQNIEAEKSVIGAMLIDNEVIPTVLGLLKSEDFYLHDHKEIYESIGDLFNEGEPIDVITVSDKLSSRGTLDSIGGLQYIMSLADFVITSANVKYYSDIITEKSILRKLIRASGEISQDAFDPSKEVIDVLANAEDKIFNIVQNRNIKEFSSMKEILDDVFSRLDMLYKVKGSITGISTGFIDLDEKLSGLQKSDLILLAARPAMGKSALALNIAQYAAMKNKIPVAIFSLEMSKDQLVTRILSSESLVDSRKLKTGQIEVDEWTRLAEAAGDLMEAPIYIDDTTDISIMDIRSKCKKLKMDKGVGLVVIDYLQLIQGRAGAVSRQQEVSEISRSLKVLAKELQVPVITLSQLSRAPEQRKEDHRPILSDIRESGAIEQDADIVMFIYRDDYYNEESEEKNIAEIIIAKHRNGSTGTVKLLWNGEFTKFRNLLQS